MKSPLMDVPPSWGDVKLGDPVSSVGSIASVPGTPGSSMRFSAVPAAAPAPVTVICAPVSMPLLSSTRSATHKARSPSPSRRSPPRSPSPSYRPGPPRSPSPSYRAVSPRTESPSKLKYVPVTRVVNVQDNSMLQAALTGIQEQFQELNLALLEERRARQQMEAQLQVQLATVTAEVVKCKEVSAGLESTLMDDRRLRQQMQSQFQEQIQRLAREVADERHERQQMKENFQAHCQGMHTALTHERQERQHTDVQFSNQVQGAFAQLEDIQVRVHKLENPPEDPIKVAIKGIERRGNLKISFETGQVTLVQPMNFMPKKPKDGTDAELQNIHVADSICCDLAEVSKIFRCPMTIEGHTKGGESDFWQAVAENRARVIAEKVVQFGADPNIVNTRGLPGRKGLNVATTKIFMDIHNSNPSLMYDKESSALGA